MDTDLNALFLLNKQKFRDVVPASLLQKPRAHVSFPEEITAYFQSHPKSSFDPKDIIDPHRCTNLIEQILKEKGLAWCYGGYLEDRSLILKESYLKEERRFIHLGIDIVLPIDAPVLAALDGIVHISDSDYPEEGGWGNYIVLAHELGGVPFYSITGHLDNRSMLGEGMKVSRGDTVGWVGNQEENGFWFPHTHAQFVSQEEMKKVQRPFTLDGYGAKENLAYLKTHYPDPLLVLPMAAQ